MSLVLALFGALRAALRTHADLALENLALRQQLALLIRRSTRTRFGLLDRAFWTWKSRRGRTGRPPVNSELAKLVRAMALANPLWGTPRIHGELLYGFVVLLQHRRGHLRRGVPETSEGIGIVEVLTAPRSPWQNPFAERVIGTIRREFLDHVIILNEGHLRRRLRSYLRNYHGSRTHLALEKDPPEPRAVEPPERGAVVALPQVGGLHHRYVRRAA